MTNSSYYKDWYKKNGRKRDPVKTKAHRIVGYAVSRGNLVRPSRCSYCNDKGKIEAHHDDYSKPLEVIWLCIKCHRYKHPGEGYAYKIKPFKSIIPS